MSLPTSSGLAKYKGKTHTLNTGQIIPAIGLGTFQDPDEQEGSVYTALKNGYRHIDTAHNYGTEKQVGKGIKRGGVPREGIFLTSKLWCNAHHPDDVGPVLDESLRDLDTDYVDLHLEGNGKAVDDGEDKSDWRVTFVKWHADKGIRIIQFSPCGSLNTFYRDVSWAQGVAQMTRLIDHPALLEVAKQHGKSPIQIALAWGVGNGRFVIPKSTIEWQIRENIVADQIVLNENDLKNIEKNGSESNIQ